MVCSLVIGASVKHLQGNLDYRQKTCLRFIVLKLLKLIILKENRYCSTVGYLLQMLEYARIDQENGIAEKNYREKCISFLAFFLIDFLDSMIHLYLFCMYG